MYIIEGTIGAGKTTFLKLLKQFLPACSISFEPLERWQSTAHGQSLLSHFYENPKRWAYTMETWTMSCRVREHIMHQNKMQTYPNTFIERSVYSGHYCFASNSFEQGFMTSMEWQSYNAWYDFLVPSQCKSPLGFIYIRVNPEIAYERVKKRNRTDEKEITLPYLQQIHEKHEAFLIHQKKSLQTIKLTPVLILDLNDDFETNKLVQKDCFGQVQKFIQVTQSTFKPAYLDPHTFDYDRAIIDHENQEY